MRKNLHQIVTEELVANQYRLAAAVTVNGGLSHDSLENIARDITERLDTYVAAIKDEQEN